MSIFLNVLFIAVSVFYLVGRLYEINFAMDLETGFLSGDGIVTSAFMMFVICVIAVCCGIILFAKEKRTNKKSRMPVGILGIMAGVFFVIGGIVSSANCFKYGGFILYHMMEAVGGIGFIILGIINIKGDKKERLPVILALLVPVGVCMNSVLHEIKSIQDTEYLMRSLAGLLSLIFLVLLFREAYAPDKTSRAMLYISGLINFVFTGVGSLAAVIGNIMTGGSTGFAQLRYNVGFIFIGLYSVFIAFFISPAKSSGYEEDEPEEKPQPRKQKRRPRQEKPVREQYNFGQTGNINKAAIEELFAQKEAREKQMEEKAAQSVPEEKTSQIYIPQAPVSAKQESTEEKTAVISRTVEKSVFKGDGKKSATKKIVYKAPK